jgi:hypothetical protein
VGKERKKGKREEEFGFSRNVSAAFICLADGYTG